MEDGRCGEITNLGADLVAGALGYPRADGRSVGVGRKSFQALAKKLDRFLVRAPQEEACLEEAH